MKADNSAVFTRTVLHGVGVMMARPWLESISELGDEVESGHEPPAFSKHFAALFMGKWDQFLIALPLEHEVMQRANEECCSPRIGG